MHDEDIPGERLPGRTTTAFNRRSSTPLLAEDRQEMTVTELINRQFSQGKTDFATTDGISPAAEE